MFEPNDAAFLLRAIELNNCLLFLGAGFSTSALNRLKANLPLGRELADQLWQWLAYAGSYDGTPLAEMYQAALSSGRPLEELRSFMESRALVSSVPPSFLVLPRVFWYRLYTTNVDDAVEVAYRAGSRVARLDVIDGSKADYRDRDQFLGSTQYVKLNGTLPGDPRDITFATRAYAKRSAEYDVWYDHFVRDYAGHPTVFVGTELNEPLFWQAIESRSRRGRDPEERPRSFLVAPSISPARLPVLRELHVHYVSGTTESFLRWLEEKYTFPGRGDVIGRVAPDVTSLLANEHLSPKAVEALEDFLTVFQRVPVGPNPSAGRKEFFLGASPTWGDLARDYDAPRKATAELLGAVNRALSNPTKIAVLGVLGEGGAGKSTILHRTALTLRQLQSQVFYADGAQRPDVATVATAIEALPQRAVLFIDNAHLFGPALFALVKTLEGLASPPVLVFAARFNLFEKHLRSLAGDPFCELFELGDLTDEEIRALVGKLTHHVQLGKLEPLSAAERFQAFKVRARKQILVAMREATQGEGFATILRSELEEIEGGEPRILFLCASLATAENVDLTREQWFACSQLEHTATVTLLRRVLRGLLVSDTERGVIAARHPLIAEFMVSEAASRLDVQQAYVRVLTAIGHDTYRGRGRRNRSWRLFVRLINHRRIYERFIRDLEMARAIYQAVAEFFRRDGHFWLQFANLELEFGQPGLARAHLAHAEALMPNDPKVITTKAHLILREGVEAGNYEDASRLRREAEDILLAQIKEDGAEDEYPFHVYLLQSLNWLKRWETGREQRRTELDKLRAIGDLAIELHGYSRKIREIVEGVRLEYMRTAT